MIRRILKKILLLITVFGLYVVTVIGFGLLRSPSSRLDTILESREDCTVPCWQQLEPNVSLLSDFQNVRGKLPSLKYAFVRKDLDYLENPIYHWFDFRTGMPTEIYLENNQIIRIIFTPGIKARFDSQASSLTVEEVFSELGHPDTYILETLGVGAFGNLYLFYENEGLVFTIVIGERPANIKQSSICTLPVTGELPVRRITIVRSGASENMLLDSVGEVFAKGLVIRKWSESGSIILDPCY